MILVLAALLFPACQRKGDEALYVRKAVRDYNDALVQAYFELSADPLTEVASVADQRSNEIIIEKLRFGKNRMRSTIREFRFEEVRVEKGGRAYARTREQWSVEKINVESGEVTSPVDIINYNLEYFLVRSPRGGWIVDRVATIGGSQ